MCYTKTIHENEAIFVIFDDEINDFLAQKLVNDIEKKHNNALDMRHVKNINSKYFIECLIANKFKLINLNSEIMVLLSIILKNGDLKAYMNMTDFHENKRELKRRRFYAA